MMKKTRTCELPGPPAPPSGSQATRRETRGDYDGRQELASSGSPAPASGSQATQATRRETRGDYDGRQELASFRDPRHHHPVPKVHKLQEGRQGEIMMGDKNLQVFPGAPAPASASQATRRETRGDYDGRQELTSSGDARRHHPVPNSKKGDKRRL